MSSTFYPIEKLQLSQDNFLAHFHHRRPKDFPFVRLGTKRRADILNRVVELCVGYEEYFQGMEAMNISLTLKRPVLKDDVGNPMPPKLPTLSKSAVAAGTWFPLGGLGQYAKRIDDEIASVQKKIDRSQGGIKLRSMDRCAALEQIRDLLAPARHIVLEWIDWHFFIYAMRCCLGHSNGRQTLGLDPKYPSAALPASRRLKIQTFLEVLSSDKIGVDKGRVFARCMLALYDAACHHRGCLGHIDQNNGCRYSVGGVCTYVADMSPELFDAVHLWYPRLVRRAAIELNNTAVKRYPEKFAHYKRGQLLGKFVGYLPPAPPVVLLATYDENNRYILFLVSCALFSWCMWFIFER